LLGVRFPDGERLAVLPVHQTVLAGGEMTMETSVGLAAARCAKGTLRVVTERHDGVEELRFSLNDARPQPGSFWIAWDGAKIAGHVAPGSAVVFGKVALRVAADGTVSDTLPNNLDLLLDAEYGAREIPNLLRAGQVALPVEITAGARVVKAEASLPVREGVGSVTSALEGIAKRPIAWATPADPQRPRPTILVEPGGEPAAVSVEVPLEGLRPAASSLRGTKVHGCFHKLRDLELVAVRMDLLVNKETCGPYRRHPDADHAQDRWVEIREEIVNVTVYEARTGRRVAMRDFPKTQPPSCPTQEIFLKTDHTRVITGEPDEGAIAEWLDQQ
jgi:hypothetical protein